jgi:uncharacterized RDD family membrane protein YckC
VHAMRVTKAVAGILLVVGLVFVATGIFLATQSTPLQSRHEPNPLIFVGIGLLLVVDATILLVRARTPLTPVAPDFGLAASSGPFGLDGPRAVDITRVYRLNHGVLTIVVTGATVVFITTGTTLRIQWSLLSAVIGVAIGLAVSAYVALALQRNSLEVGPRGITLTGPGMRKTIPWANVESVGVQNGRCIVRVRNAPTSRNPMGSRNRDFSAYLRVKENASLPGLIALYVNERAPAPPPSCAGLAAPFGPASPAPPPFGAPLAPPSWSATSGPPAYGTPPPPPPLSAGQARLMYRRAGLGVRLAAWFIDVIVIAVVSFVLAVIIDAVLIGLNKGVEVPSDATPALYAGFGITLVVYLVGCWHASATLGMWILRLRVLDAVSGLPPSWARSLVRFGAAIPSMVVVIPFGLLGVLGPERLALHDRVARTLVVSIGALQSATGSTT